MVSPTFSTIGYASNSTEEACLIKQQCNIIIRSDILQGIANPQLPLPSMGMFNGFVQVFPANISPPSGNYNPVSSDFSAELMVKPTSLSSIQCLVSCRDVEGKGWELMVSTDGSVFIQGTNSFVQTPSGVVQPTTPVHCRFSRKDGVAQIHINGTLRAKGLLNTASSTVQMVIGRKTTNEYPFAGEMTSFNYWNQALIYSGDTIGVNYFTPPTWPI